MTAFHPTVRTLQLAAITLVLAAVTFPSAATAQAPPGRWEGTIRYDSVTVTFPFELVDRNGAAVATFFNGTERITSTGSQRVGDTLIVTFAHLATELRLTVSDTLLAGVYGNRTRRGFRPVTFRPAPVRPSGSDADVPDIDGLWFLPNETSKGEQAWRFVVTQRGPHVGVTILRVDGDAGLHEGEYHDGRWVLDHFDGSRASRYEIVPQPDRTLQMTVYSPRAAPRIFHAVRPEAALAQGLPVPADFAAHTSVKDPAEPFRFAFPDLNGQLVSNTDDRFLGKVVVVNVTGSWCPNCHDEAPFLVELYDRYRTHGLEIVALTFEEEEQLQNPERLRAFLQRYGITYTYLVGGTPDEVTDKLPQAENLNSWPTTFFLGRDGRVRSVHAGFAAKASGAFHDALKREYTAILESLLAEPVPDDVRRKVTPPCP